MPRGQGGTLSGFTPLSTPNAPTIDGVSTSIGSASVSFTAPSDTGDAAVTSYIVTAVDESTGASSGATGTESPISISPGGGTFKIRMQAVNGFGPGRLSEYDTGNVIYAGAELYAWGSNASGQIGDGTRVNRSSPVQIGALTTWAQVSGSNTHSASVKADSTIWTWGQNNYGKLGLGNVVDRSSPVQVGALTNWAQVSTGRANTAAVKTDNTLWVWGRNNSGQLGQNDRTDRSSPVQVGVLTNWSQVSVGTWFMLAVKTDSTLWALGNNGQGRLGNNTVVNRSSPVQVGALTTWAQVSTGDDHTAAIKVDGTLWSWGNCFNGQLGIGVASTYRSSPVQVGALTNWSQVSAGLDFSGSVKTDGTLWTWGKNSSGELGDGTTTQRNFPVQVGALTNWSQVSAGQAFMGSVKTDGTLWTWGSNSGGGKLGTDYPTDKSSPVQVGALTSWLQVSTGFNHALALVGV